MILEKFNILKLCHCCSYGVSIRIDLGCMCTYVGSLVGAGGDVDDETFPVSIINFLKTHNVFIAFITLDSKLINKELL